MRGSGKVLYIVPSCFYPVPRNWWHGHNMLTGAGAHTSHSSSPERWRLPCISILLPPTFLWSQVCSFLRSKNISESRAHMLWKCLSNRQCVRVAQFSGIHMAICPWINSFFKALEWEIFRFTAPSSVCQKIASHHIVLECSVVQWQMCIKFVRSFKLC